MMNQGDNPELPEGTGVPVPIPLVLSRIVVVTAVGVASALGLFILMGGWWVVGGIVFGSTFAFIFLMFYIERLFGREDEENGVEKDV